MPSEYQNEAEKEYTKEMMNKIFKRAESASPKVVERAQRFVGAVDKMGGDQFSFNHVIEKKNNDFYTLRDNPKDECGGGEYEGWTREEIEELYKVLYGEDMED